MLAKRKVSWAILFIGLASLFCTTVFADYDSNLICHYKFEDSGNLGKDETDKHNGAVYGSPDYNASGLKGSSVVLDGIDDYISVDSNNVFNTGENGSFTYSAFFQSDDYTERQVVLSRSHPCSCTGHFAIYTQGHRVYLSFYSNLDGPPEMALYSDAILRDGQSYRVFWQRTWGQTGTKLFVNGAERKVNGDTAARGTTYSELPIFIGALNGNDGHTCQSSPSPNYYFAGTIDEVAIWNRIISVDDMCDFAGETYYSFTDTNYSIQNDQTELVFDCFGAVKALNYNGVNQLIDESGVIGKVTFSDGISGTPKQVERDATDLNLYHLTYIDSSMTINMRIEPNKNSFIFKIESDSTIPNDVNVVNMFEIPLLHSPAINADWAKNAASNILFVLSLPLDSNVVVWNTDRYCWSSYDCNAGCKVNKRIWFSPTAGALLTARKSDYYDSMEGLVNDFNLPDVRHDGKWFRASGWARESYLLAEVTNNNNDTILDCAVRGHFKQLAAIDPLKLGMYNSPRSFSNINQFYTVMNKFSANDVNVGIHTFINRVEYGDNIFSDVNIYKIKIGSLAQDINNGNGVDILLDSNGSEKNVLTHFSQTVHTKGGYFLVIGNELLKCNSYSSPNTLIYATRGWYGTASASHDVNTPVYLAPQYCGFYLNPDEPNALQKSIASFADVVNDVNVKFLYCDGDVYPYGPGFEDEETKFTFMEKFGFMPYFEAFKAKGKLMPLQFAENSGSCNWWYCSRVASWDGPVFKAKDFTREFKVPTVIEYGQYGMLRAELGWWQILNGNVTNGKNDYETTTSDDVDYVMTKALALETSVGVELGSPDVPQVAGLLCDLIGKYHNLIREDIDGNIVPAHIKEYLSDKYKEAEISNVCGWNLIKKEVNRMYAVWNSNNSYTYGLNNKFGSQKLRMELRPRFDYYDYNNSNNVTITDFSNLNSICEVSSSYMNCSVFNKQIILTNTNQSSAEYCKIVVRNNNAINLSNKRGIGLSIIGDGKGEEIVVSLKQTTQQPFMREFRFNVDFSDTCDLILGDPWSYMENSYKTPNTNPNIHWGYDWSQTSYVSVYVIVPPNSSCTLTFNSMKALAEKGTNQLVSPKLTIGSNEITFPVTLSTAANQPYILEYNGYLSQYKVYDEDYKLLKTGYITHSPIVTSGNNTVNVTSDTNSDMYSRRADVRIFTYDDEDFDGIPTNGDYNDQYNPRGQGRSNFYDDNCPNVYNPKQDECDCNNPPNYDGYVQNVTQSTSYVRIQDAIGEANNGDEIIVYPGTYYESISLNGKSITLRSADPNDWDVVKATVIDANSSYDTFNIQNADGSVITGFTITGAGDAGFNITSTDIVIDNCLISDNGWYGIYAWYSTLTVTDCNIHGNYYGILSGTTYEGLPQSLITNNVIYNNDTAIYLNTPVLIANNMIYNNSYGGINYECSWEDCDITIQNNTIVNNESYGIYSGDAIGYTTITNCILWDNGDDLTNGSSATYSCIQNNDAGTGNIHSDPCFVDAANNDFHIKINSPCINAGYCGGNYADQNDIDGQSRVMGRCVDIGADEVNFNAPEPNGHWWKLDETGNITAYDSIGTTNGTFNGNDPCWVTGHIGGAVDFNGVSDYFAISSLDSSYYANSTFTITGWFKTSKSTGIQTIAGNWSQWYYSPYPGVNMSMYSGWQVLVENKKVVARFATNSPGLNNITGASDVNDGEWHHFAMVHPYYHGQGTSNTVLYVDGQSEGTPAVLYHTNSNTKFRIGDGSYIASGSPVTLKGGPFCGTIDDVMIFNRALTAAEVWQLYEAGQ
jgi:hypothetical protein